MAHVGIYTRISLDRSGDSLSPERQEELCRQYAEAMGKEVAGVFLDRDISGWKDKDRPAFSKLLAAVEDGTVDTVMAYSLSRLGRRASRLLELLDFLRANGASLVLYDQKIDTSTAMGKLFFTITAAFAELEAEMTSERVRSAELVGAQAGKRHGGGSRGYGYDRADNIVEDEASVIREASAAILAGTSLRKIARDLNSRGIRTSTGREWSSATLGQMLRSPRLAGVRVHEVWQGEGAARRLVSREAYPATWEPILSEAEHSALVDALTRTPGARKQVRVHLLSGIARCGLCGGALKTMGFVMRNGKSFPRYQCLKQPGSVNCGKVAASKVAMDRVVKERWVDELSHSELVTPADDTADRRRSLELDITSDREALVELTRDRYVRRTVDAESFEVAKADLDARLAENEGALAGVVRREAEAKAALPPAGRAELEAWWEAASLDDQRNAIRSAFEYVRLWPAKRRGGNVFDESRVDSPLRLDRYQRMVEAFEAEVSPAEAEAMAAEDAAAREAWEAEN